MRCGSIRATSGPTLQLRALRCRRLHIARCALSSLPERAPALRGGAWPAAWGNALLGFPCRCRRPAWPLPLCPLGRTGAASFLTTAGPKVPTGRGAATRRGPSFLFSSCRPNAPTGRGREATIASLPAKALIPLHSSAAALCSRCAAAAAPTEWAASSRSSSYHLLHVHQRALVLLAVSLQAPTNSVTAPSLSTRCKLRTNVHHRFSRTSTPLRAKRRSAAAAAVGPRGGGDSLCSCPLALGATAAASTLAGCHALAASRAESRLKGPMSSTGWRMRRKAGPPSRLTHTPSLPSGAPNDGPSPRPAPMGLRRSRRRRRATLAR